MSWYEQKTAELRISTFWEEVEDGWESLKLLCRQFHPAYLKQHRMPITAPAAESICEQARIEILLATKTDPLEKMDFAKETKDVGMLHKIMNDVWFGMPESSAVRGEPGFGLCCDICSDAPTEY